MFITLWKITVQSCAQYVDNYRLHFFLCICGYHLRLIYTLYTSLSHWYQKSLRSFPHFHRPYYYYDYALLYSCHISQ